MVLKQLFRCLQTQPSIYAWKGLIFFFNASVKCPSHKWRLQGSGTQWNEQKNDLKEKLGFGLLFVFHSPHCWTMGTESGACHPTLIIQGAIL